VLKRGLRKYKALATNCQLQFADLDVCASKFLHGTARRQKWGIKQPWWYRKVRRLLCL